MTDTVPMTIKYKKPKKVSNKEQMARETARAIAHVALLSKKYTKPKE